MVSINATAGTTYAPLPDQPIPAAVQPAPLEAAAQAAPPPAPAPSAPIADSTVAALVAEQSQDAQPADLRGQDLRSMDLKGLMLRGADLSGANLSGMDLSGLDLRGARLDGAALAGAKLSSTKLDGVSARGADFSDASLINTSFDGADFSQARFDRAFIGKEPPGVFPAVAPDRMLIAKDVKLEGASFKGAEFQLVGLANAEAAGADFSGAVANVLVIGAGSDLTGASFDGMSGRDARFGGSNLSGAAFTNTTVSQAAFTATTMDGVKFAGSSLSGKTFSLTDLRQADFTGVLREARYAVFNIANLDGLDFSGFDFTGAKFVGSPNSYDGPDRPPAGAAASTSGTNFAGAKFDHAMFQEIPTGDADFTGADFTRVLSMGASGLLGRDGVVDGWTNGWSRSEYEEQFALQWNAVSGGRSKPAPADGLIAPSPEATAAQSALKSIGDLQGAPADKAAQTALATLKAINEDIRKSQDALREQRATEAADDPEGKPGRILQLIA